MTTESTFHLYASIYALCVAVFGIGWWAFTAKISNWSDDERAEEMKG